MNTDDWNHMHQPKTVRQLRGSHGPIEPDFLDGEKGDGKIGYCTKHCLQADLVGPDKHQIRCNYMKAYNTNRTYVICEPWVREFLLEKD